MPQPSGIKHSGATREAKLWPLESIRGIAALVVVNWHFVELFAKDLLDGKSNHKTGSALIEVLAVCGRTPLRLLIDGEMAVRMFFVLSGFVLSLSYVRQRDPAIVRSASIRRFPRLAIPAWCSIAVSYILFATGMAAPERLAQQCDWIDSTRALADAYPSPTIRAPIAEAATVFFYGVREPSFNRALWTMQIEFTGSLLVFAVLAILGTALHRIGFYALIAAVLSLTGATYYVDFVVGLLLCEVFTRPTGIRGGTVRANGFIWFLLVSVGLFIAWIPAAWFASVPFGVRIVALKPTIAAAAIIAGSTKSSTISSLLSLPCLTWLGRVSFSLYLLHLPVMLSVGVWAFLGGVTILPYPAALAGAFAATMVVLLPLSHLYTLKIDNAAVRLARWGDQRLNPPVIASI